MATLSQKIKLLRGLLSGEKAYTGPFFVLVDITRRCNLHCLGCRFHSSQMSGATAEDADNRDLSFNLFEKLCHELEALGTRALVLLGEGEPLLHPQVFDMIATAKALGFHTMLITNGTLLGDRMESLLDSRLDALQVSLWAASIEEYQINYPGTPPAYFKKVVDSVTLLNSLKSDNRLKLPNVILHHPINRHNFQGVGSFLELAFTTGCDGVSFAPFCTWGGAFDSSSLSPDEEQSLLLSLKETERRINSVGLEHNIGQTLMRYRIGKQIWQNVPCYIGWTHARIKIDGSVYPCGHCKMLMGNIESNSFREIWSGVPYRNFRNQASTRQGLASLSRQCNCEYCCFLNDNLRVHRLFKWVSPFARHPQPENPCPEN
jgi:radical SAM protein with 4Fe4S-binding SPASM domain